MTLRPLRRHALRIAGAATLSGALACRPATLTPVPVPVPAPEVAADSIPRRVPSERPCAIPMSDEEMRRAAWAGYRATFATLDLAGHHIGRIERPALFAALITDWLDRVERSLV